MKKANGAAEILPVLALVLAMTGCSTVTIDADPQSPAPVEPTYQERKSFYLAGLVGESRVDVQEICGDKKVAKMQSKQTFMDGFLGVITLGIYAPHTVTVWCE